MNRYRWLVLALVAASIAAFFALGLDRYLSLDFFKSQQAAIARLLSRPSARAAAIYFAIYVAVTGLSLPGRRDH